MGRSDGRLRRTDDLTHSSGDGTVKIAVRAAAEPAATLELLRGEGRFASHHGNNSTCEARFARNQVGRSRPIACARDNSAILQEHQGFSLGHGRRSKRPETWQAECYSRSMYLNPQYRPAPRLYQQEILQELYESPELLNEGLLSFEYPLFVADDEELEYFLGKLIRSAGKGIGGVAKTVGKGLSAIDKVVPVSTLVSASPLGMAFRAGLGAAQAAAEGRNVFQGAMRSLAATPGTRFLIDTGLAAARGENIVRAAQKAAQAGIGDVRKSLQFAAMVAPFVPGIGTGVAAALGAANALASGQPITESLIAAARSALPGGAIAQVAFDTAMNLAKGKNVGEALLNSARSRLPGGPAAQAAFDAAVTLAKGKSLQDAAFAAAGRILPPSPYAADALLFVKKVASGQNIQRAALSTAGNFILNRIERQTGPILSSARARFPQVPPRLAASRAARAAAMARARRRPWLPVPGRYRELSEIEFGAQRAQSGRWVRRDGCVILLGV